MKQAFLPAMVFIDYVVLPVTGQEAPKSVHATAAELETARQNGAAAAVADAKAGDFGLWKVPDFPWGNEWDELASKRGLNLRKMTCRPFGEAERVCLDAETSAYDEAMLREIKRHFGDDFLTRLREEAKALYEAKVARISNTTKPSTPKVRSAKSKKRSS